MNKKQSLFHIAKRDTLPWYKSFAIRGCAIILALVVCAVVTMLMTGENPVSIYATIFKGAFGSARKTWVTFQNLAVLLGRSDRRGVLSGCRVSCRVGGRPADKRQVGALMTQMAGGKADE